MEIVKALPFRIPSPICTPWGPPRRPPYRRPGPKRLSRNAGSVGSGSSIVIVVDAVF